MYSDPRDLWLVISDFLSDLCLVLCCDIYRNTLISIMYSACMIKYMIVNRGHYTPEPPAAAPLAAPPAVPSSSTSSLGSRFTTVCALHVPPSSGPSSSAATMTPCRRRCRCRPAPRTPEQPAAVVP